MSSSTKTRPDEEESVRPLIPWQELKDSLFTPQEQRAIDRESLADLRRWRLAKLREALSLSQEEVAARLDRGQAAISRMERREDVRLSTLRAYVDALGGRLRLVAEFPQGAIEVDPGPEK